MAIENQTTSTSAGQNSADQTTSDLKEQGSSTSTTQETEAASTEASTEGEDNINLGKKPEGEASTETETEEKVEETDEEKAAREAKEADEAETTKLFGAPEGDAGYELTLDEGVTLDAKLLETVTPIAKKLNLSNEGLSMLAKDVLPAVQAQAFDALQGDIVAQRAAWETETRQTIAGKDAEGKDITLKNGIGKPISFDGKGVKDVQPIAAKALDHLAPEGFREWLEETGLGVHPMMVAFAYNAGKSIAEETDFEASGTDAGKPKSRTEKYYG